MIEVQITPEQAQMILERHNMVRTTSDALEKALSDYAYVRRDLHSAISVLIGGIEFEDVELEGTTLFIKVPEEVDARTNVQPVESGEE